MVKYIVSVIILVGLASTAYSQNDFSGEWKGKASWGVKNFTMSMTIDQDGKKITGTALTKNINNEKFIKYEFYGQADNGILIARGVKMIERKGMTHCMPAFVIKYSEQDPNRILGKWKANSGANSCWVPGTGGMDLTRVYSKQPAVASREVAIAEDDIRGNALSKQLQKQKYYALFIAVQDYRDENIVDLNEPIDDAVALRNELVNEYNFIPEDITVLKNPDRSTIIETFDGLTKKVGENDNFLIFYAGHGIWDEQIEQGYWLPSDAKKSSKAAWLSNGTIRDYIRAIDSKHTLLITDACFSGGILKTREAFTASKAMLEMYNLPSRKAMTSGALKTVPDKSVFIEYLVKALQSNQQPLISADQLFTSFKYNVINNSPNGQVPQYGVISQADDEGGDFIFLKQ